ncbi:MAG: hypothetical protein WC602_04925 [archaeon]
MKYIAEFEKRFGRRPSFTIRDCRIFLSKKGISGQYLHALIHNLLKKEKLKRISRGIYTFNSEPAIAGAAFVPSYHGLQEALSIHGLWDQEAGTVIITPRKVRSGLREILGSNVLARRISKRMFFGFEPAIYSNTCIFVSDPEKTIIDLAYFRENISPGVIAEAKKRLDRGKMKKYLARSPPWVGRRIKKLFGGL